MAKIYDALYKTAINETIVNLTSLTPKDYREKYRGNLYCSTPNCSAMITYVMRAGNKNHFRTWRGTLHSKDCEYYSEKIAGRIGIRASFVDYIYLSGDQMSRSMKEAYLQELMTPEEKVLAKQKVKNPRKRTGTLEGNEQISFELTTDPEHKDKSQSGQKARLYRRDVNALTTRDIGLTRTVIGEYVEADFSNERPVVRIKKQDVYANILFEEAFFAENIAGRDRLSTISKYFDIYTSLIIVAVGEIRQSSVLEEFEIVLFDYKAFRVNGRSLDSLAVGETIQQWIF
ncbi:hypothetical protein BBI15_15120 [Planococcus plakortidis]|uniref:Uncharacterized protein n=1 Tax=Planococcus plakortidis TaxID=1038856 RepID=A0A1C7EBS1_9BACL|nr:hypothetical protein [Planococcus plakortidis]ANU21414.1 hypothetical protein BBI15_15120 [Planococcus plakortidis]